MSSKASPKNLNNTSFDKESNGHFYIQLIEFFGGGRSLPLSLKTDFSSKILRPGNFKSGGISYIAVLISSSSTRICSCSWILPTDSEGFQYFLTYVIPVRNCFEDKPAVAWICFAPGALRLKSKLQLSLKACESTLPWLENS